MLPEALRTLLAEAQHFGLPELAALVKSQMALMAVAVVVARLRTGAATDDRALECDIDGPPSVRFERVLLSTMLNTLRPTGSITAGRPLPAESPDHRSVLRLKF